LLKRKENPQKGNQTHIKIIKDKCNTIHKPIAKMIHARATKGQNKFNGKTYHQHTQYSANLCASKPPVTKARKSKDLTA